MHAIATGGVHPASKLQLRTSSLSTNSRGSLYWWDSTGALLPAVSAASSLQACEEARSCVHRERPRLLSALTKCREQ